MVFDIGRFLSNSVLVLLWSFCELLCVGIYVLLCVRSALNCMCDEMSMNTSIKSQPSIQKSSLY